jgi:hypothetical protein
MPTALLRNVQLCQIDRVTAWQQEDSNSLLFQARPTSLHSANKFWPSVLLLTVIERVVPKAAPAGVPPTGLCQAAPGATSTVKGTYRLKTDTRQRVSRSQLSDGIVESEQYG